jgi:circadian clock protein KaiB
VSTGEHDGTLPRFEARTGNAETAEYVLSLFVNGASDMSARAIRNVRAICDEHLTGRYQLEVVDVHRDASLMSAHDVVAAPTLIKESPLPKRMLVGDLSDTPRVLAALDIAPREVTSAAPPATVG